MLIDLIGQTFNRLTVISRAEHKDKKNAYWNCQCKCGSLTISAGCNLKSGASKSCGCLSHEAIAVTNTTHGASIGSKKEWASVPREYRTWVSMRDRVRNPKKECYKKISVCDRWLNSYENFLEDMGKAPGNEHQIDRIDNSKGYSPGNCRWVTPSENCRNKTNNRMIEWRGRSMCLTDWQEELNSPLGLTSRSLRNRLNRGWSVERAFTTSSNGNAKINNKTDVD